ncbi:hypothetical protein NDR87_13240 [Nocardia sp. CDC159]|uniref:Uncharacterized protein n=1 Tax=Nocardia pulmonis TaxID=2951408 RepID=A0A9X2IZ62_9NOCA|nr:MULTISPECIES: hypothetical protein [Nocardia]MCM6774611.1 hypothetical protein [Nocardia pulmonis]MCM6787324.1 hypothetical protein [Nocardia sp. CDC159]
MGSKVPLTVKAVDTAELMRLEEEAAVLGLNGRAPVEWLERHVDHEATHYLRPVLAHHLEERPRFSPHWRCLVLVTMRDGRQVCAGLDVLPATFERLPDTLEEASQSTIGQTLDGPIETLPDWARRNDV